MARPTERTDEGSLSDEHTLAADGQPSLAAEAQSAGSVVGRYVVLGLVGRGAHGDVLAAYDPDLDRKVALKLLRSRESPDEDAALLGEAQALAQLSHPNVVAIHDVGREGGRVFLAMEFIEGQTLREWQKVERPWEDTVARYLQAARGLAAAHDKGLTHLDFKPDNVMIDASDRVRVTDFGLAHAAGSTTETKGAGSSFQSSGTLRGTPAYMAPEQWQERETSPLTDQFAFCVALWEAVYGRRPFPGKGSHELALAVTGDAVPTAPPSRAPTWLRELLKRGLSRDPKERYASMSELILALESGATRRRRQRSIVALAALGVAALAALGWARHDEHKRIAACDAEAATIDELWNDEVRRELHDAIAGAEWIYAPETASHVTPWLDRFARAWTATRRDVCLERTVNETLNDDIASKAAWCLDESLIEMQVFLDRTLEPNEHGLVEAVASAAKLRDPRACTRDEILAEVDVPTASHRARYEELNQLLAEAEVELRRQDLEEAERVIERALRLADELGSRAHHTRALLTKARLLTAMDENAESIELSVDAFVDASSASQWGPASAAALQVAIGLGTAAKYEEAIRWVRLAEVAIAQHGDPMGMYAIDHARVSGILHHRSGEWTRARASFERAIELAERNLGTQHPALTALMNDLGVAATGAGEHERAIELHQRALALNEAVLGSRHPSTVRSLSNIGVAQISAGHAEEAVETLERALRAREALLGPDAIALVPTLGGLAEAHDELKNFDRALELHGRALEIALAARGPQHPLVAITHHNIAEVHLGAGHAEKAREGYQRALELMRESLPPEHPYLAFARGGLGRSMLALGDHEEARRLLEAAKKSLEGTEESAQSEEIDAALAELDRHGR